MMDRGLEISPRQRARIAGAFYLLTIVMGVFAEVFVRGKLVVRGNATATASNILAHERLYRFGLAADLIMIACYIVVTLLLYLLLKPVSRTLSLLAALFSMVGIAVLAANSLNHVAPLVLLRSGHLSVFETAHLQSLSLLSLNMHTRGYIITGVFFGIYCLAIGALVFRSGFLPRAIGVLMAIGGLGYLANSFAVFLLPTLAARLPDVTVLGGIAELSLTLWLMVFGVNAQRWEESRRLLTNSQPRHEPRA